MCIAIFQCSECSLTLSLCNLSTHTHAHTQTHLSHFTHPSLSLLSALAWFSFHFLSLPNPPAAIRRYFTWRLDLRERGEHPFTFSRCRDHYPSFPLSNLQLHFQPYARSWFCKTHQGRRNSSLYIWRSQSDSSLKVQMQETRVTQEVYYCTVCSLWC